MVQKRIKKTAVVKRPVPVVPKKTGSAQAPKKTAVKRRITPPQKHSSVSTELIVAESRPVVWYFVLAVAAISFGLGTYLALKGKPMGWEYAVFMSINGWAEGWYRLFTIITFFGSTLMAMLSVVSLYLAGFYRLALRLAFASLGAYAVAFLAKHFIGRARPVELFDGVHARVAEAGMGYPSGHATFITVLVLTLLPYTPRSLRWFIAVSAIGLVCLSRLYLGVHLPLDLLGGIAIGAGAVAFIHILPKKLQRLLRIN
jgi:glycosyltransferase 2 family protein